MKKLKLSPDKLEEYQAFINTLNDVYDDLPDGGNFNGYIAVTPEHPFYGKDYDEVNAMLHKKDFYVHGGLTLTSDSSFCPHLPTEHHQFWVLGFDTRHAGDTAEYWIEERTWEEADKLMQAAINYGD